MTLPISSKISKKASTFNVVHQEDTIVLRKWHASAIEETSKLEGALMLGDRTSKWRKNKPTGGSAELQQTNHALRKSHSEVFLSLMSIIEEKTVSRHSFIPLFTSPAREKKLPQTAFAWESLAFLTFTLRHK